MIVDRIIDTITVGTITHGSELVRNYGLNVMQHDVCSMATNGIDELCALEILSRECSTFEHEVLLT